MNRLIILGNGFDKAHGLPTTYSEFILDYLKDSLIKSINSRGFKDQNLFIDRKYNKEIKGKQHLNKANNLKSILDFKELILETLNGYSIYEIQYKNLLLKDIVDQFNSEVNWVDIEQLYFDKLNKYAQHITHKKASINQAHDNYMPFIEKTKALNNDFKNIRMLLIKYLKEKVDQTYNFVPHQGFIDLFNKPINESDFLSITNKTNLDLDTTCLLNFNYTRTVSNYFPKIKNNAQIISIHGQLSDEESIVFGYGDEMGKSYKEIEELNENEFFRFIKSHWYSKNENYRNLLRFVDSDTFEVFVIGHSCGLSDRVLLNYIFESENCKSIKVFYHKDSSHYTNVTQDISRHFNDKLSMRRKIVSFEKSFPCPQLKKEEVDISN